LIARRRCLGVDEHFAKAAEISNKTAAQNAAQHQAVLPGTGWHEENEVA